MVFAWLVATKVGLLRGCATQRWRRNLRGGGDASGLEVDGHGGYGEGQGSGWNFFPLLKMLAPNPTFDHNPQDLSSSLNQTWSTPSKHTRSTREGWLKTGSRVDCQTLPGDGLSARDRASLVTACSCYSGLWPAAFNQSWYPAEASISWTGTLLTGA